MSATLGYDGNGGPEKQAEVRAQLEANPQLADANILIASLLGRSHTVRDFLSRDPAVATTVGGPRDWPPLLYLTYGRVALQREGESYVEAARALLDAGADPNSYFVAHEHYRFTALTGCFGEGEGGASRAAGASGVRVARAATLGTRCRCQRRAGVVQPDVHEGEPVPAVVAGRRVTSHGPRHVAGARRRGEHADELPAVSCRTPWSSGPRRDAFGRGCRFRRARSRRVGVEGRHARRTACGGGAGSPGGRASGCARHRRPFHGRRSRGSDRRSARAGGDAG